MNNILYFFNLVFKEGQFCCSLMPATLKLTHASTYNDTGIYITVIWKMPSPNGHSLHITLSGWKALVHRHAYINSSKLSIRSWSGIQMLHSLSCWQTSLATWHFKTTNSGSGVGYGLKCHITKCQSMMKAHYQNTSDSVFLTQLSWVWNTPENCI